MEKPIAKGNMRMSKSKKALMIFIEGQQPVMVSTKSVQELLQSKKPYVKLWTTEAKQSEEDKEEAKENE